MKQYQESHVLHKTSPEKFFRNGLTATKCVQYTSSGWTH